MGFEEGKTLPINFLLNELCLSIIFKSMSGKLFCAYDLSLYFLYLIRELSVYTLVN